MSSLEFSVVRLDEDWHVHSTFSDGADTLAANIASATERGLCRLGCVDHVRRDTTYVPDYVAAVVAARASSPVALSIGIEAKLLDRSGALDLPADCDGVDLVYVADHQFPGADGPVSPRVVRESIAAGERDPSTVIGELDQATGAAMDSHAARHRLVLAHLFSIVPKLGLREDDVPDGALSAIAACAVRTGTIVEVSERWRCPSARMIRACVSAGVPVVASTDSHRATDIARYDYVRAASEAA
jgi:putative hydrolase